MTVIAIALFNLKRSKKKKDMTCCITALIYETLPQQTQGAGKVRKVDERLWRITACTMPTNNNSYKVLPFKFVLSSVILMWRKL